MIQSFKKVPKEVAALRYCTYKWWFICFRNFKRHWHTSSYHMVGRWLEGAYLWNDQELLCKMWYFWANNWRWRWHNGWGIQCTFQRKMQIQNVTWQQKSMRVCRFRCWNMQLLPQFSQDMVDWRVTSVKACVTEYLWKKRCDLN